MTDRTEEQERVEEALEWLEVNAKFGTLGHTADVNAKVVRDHLTRLRDHKAELERAARAVRDALQTEIKVDDAPGAIIQWYERMFDRLDAALDESHPTDVTAESHDESEGRGGGEEWWWAGDALKRCPRCGEHALEGEADCKNCGLEPEDDTTWREVRSRYTERHHSAEPPAHTPDPSEGEDYWQELQRCEHGIVEIQVPPGKRVSYRVRPGEDAEDDGRGEGRFRKRPVEVDAFRWEGDIDALYDWLDRTGFYDREQLGEEGIWTEGDTLRIDTLEGTMTAQEGDWIICGVEGEYYPCKPDIFRQTYEPATEGDRTEMLRETMDDDTFFEAWEGAEWKLARARTTIRKLKKELARYYEAENREYREMQAPTHSDADPKKGDDQ